MTGTPTTDAPLWTPICASSGLWTIVKPVVSVPLRSVAIRHRAPPRILVPSHGEVLEADDLGDRLKTLVQERL